jgi:hypothetical protein
MTLKEHEGVGKVILKLHNDISRGVYENGFKELHEMTKELKKVGITDFNDIRKLMENGVLGSVAETKQVSV